VQYYLTVVGVVSFWWLSPIKIIGIDAVNYVNFVALLCQLIGQVIYMEAGSSELIRGVEGVDQDKSEWVQTTASP